MKNSFDFVISKTTISYFSPNEKQFEFINIHEHSISYS